MASLLMVSNGHGEDTIASVLAGALMRYGHTVTALPLVGEGQAYRRANIAVVGPAKAMPSGGFVLDDPKALWSDIQSGWLGMSLKHYQAARQARKTTSATVVVGDVYALWVSQKFASKPLFMVQPRVSVRSWGTEGKRADQTYIPAEINLMKQCTKVYPREPEGLQLLLSKGVTQARYLGNPVMDAFFDGPPVGIAPPYGLLLPGSRTDWHFSLPLMLDTARVLKAVGLTWVVAWPHQQLPLAPEGWSFKKDRGTDMLQHQDLSRVYFSHHFSRLVVGARIAISTSGTAAEQAAGMGVPLVGFATPGPQYTEPFAKAQQRMLGAALTLVPPYLEDISQTAKALLADPKLYQQARTAGLMAMGERGACKRIAEDIHEHIG